MFPNFSISSSNSARFLGSFALATAILLITGIGLGTYLGAPSGDLTRIGQLASIDLKPHHWQQPLQRNSNNAYQKVDVQVLGDSFSAGNFWQSELTRQTGLKTLTWHYNDTGCIYDWIEHALNNHDETAAQTIVIETIEREFIPRFGMPQDDCKKMRGKPLDITASLVENSSSGSIFPIDIRYVIASAINHFSTSRQSGKYASRSAITVDLTTTTLFSNQRSNRLTYFHGDEKKSATWTPIRLTQAMAKLKNLQLLATQEKKQLLIIIIPDKATTYRPWIKNDQVASPLSPDLFLTLESTLGKSSNYLPAFRKAAATTIDFYNPDNTHLSLDGYRFLAKEVAKRLMDEQE